MTTPRANHTATLLSDGRVLIAGGDRGRNSALGSTEIYDPKTNRFTRAANLHDARCQHTTALLADGRVLIAGGSRKPDHDDPLASVEIYDPRSGSFTEAGRLAGPRSKLPDSATLLDGRVLVVGGAPSAEVYDPKSGSFRPADGTLDAARYYPASVQLMDGTVRIFGGYDSHSVSTAKTWIYRP